MNKELPNNASIEFAVIGGIINYPDKFSDVARYIITDDVWYEPKCRTVWNILSSMMARREHIDLMTISSELNEDYAKFINNKTAQEELF